MSGTAIASASNRVDCSTHFLFEHKLFQVAGARFALTADGSEPAFHVMLGDLNAALRLPALRNEFGIAADSQDGKLLGIIERSLRYVKEIRPGDSIPREILDGTASWSVEDYHRLRAQRRLTVQIASWIAGEERIIDDEQALEQIAEDPQTKQRVNAAMTEIAEKLGIGADRRGEVLDRIDDLARELSYVEALRDRYGAVRMVIGKVNHLAKLYRTDRAIIGDISRVQSLLMRPLADFDNIFGQVDAMTCEILTVLRKFQAQVQFIREMRDELHMRLMKWDDTIEAWEHLDPVRGGKAEAALKELYRFAARHFPQQQDWRASG